MMPMRKKILAIEGMHRRSSIKPISDRRIRGITPPRRASLPPAGHDATPSPSRSLIDLIIGRIVFSGQSFHLGRALGEPRPAICDAGVERSSIRRTLHTTPLALSSLTTAIYFPSDTSAVAYTSPFATAELSRRRSRMAFIMASWK